MVGDDPMAAVRADIIEHVITPVMDEIGIKWDGAEIYVNPTGRFVTGGPQGDTGLCLAEDTLISAKSGLVKIKDIRVGSKVYTETGNEATIVEKVDNGVRDTQVVTDERGIKIEATLNHPFRVFDGTNIIWKKCGDLEVGDILIKKRQENVCKDDRHMLEKYTKLGKDYHLRVNEDFAYLIGWLIGDGNITADDRVTFYYNYLSDIEKQHLYDAIKRVFDASEIKHYECQNDRFMILSKDLVSTLIRMGITPVKSYEKEIPDCILRASDRKKLAFLAGLFDADGHIENDCGRDGKYLAVSLVTVSARLAQQVAILLQSLGIQSTIDLRSMRSQNEPRNIRGGIIQSKHQTFSIRIIGLNSIRKFLSLYGFRLSYKNEKYKNKNFSIKWYTHDATKYYFPVLIRRLLKLNPLKTEKYFENYDAVSSIDKQRGYKGENVDYILDMFAEYGKTIEYQAVKYIYDNFEMVKIRNIEKSTAHTFDISLDDDTHSFIANGFVVHNTGRKIITDTYGGTGRHGGGAFSGKDCTKVDRSAAYAARWVAKNVVAAGLADRCEVQVSYAIGVAKPLSVMVDTFGTEHVDCERIERAVSEVFDLRPAAIIDRLDLWRPIYEKTAAYGHFGRELSEFTWERCDKVDELLRAVGLS